MSMWAQRNASWGNASKGFNSLSGLNDHWTFVCLTELNEKVAAIQAVQSKGYAPGGLPSFPTAQTHEEKAWYDALASLAPLGLALL